MFHRRNKTMILQLLANVNVTHMANIQLWKTVLQFLCIVVLFQTEICTTVVANPYRSEWTDRINITCTNGLLAISVRVNAPFQGHSASRYFCDFEEGNACNWVVTSGLLEWSISQGTGSTFAMRPRADHTKQNFKGFYMHMQSSNYPLGSSTYVTSPEILTNDQACFTFWYQMYGKHVDRLEVMLESPAKNTEVVWTRKGVQGRVWKYDQISIPKAYLTKIGLKAFADYGHEGYIAIDDVNITMGACPPRKFCTFDDNDFCGFDQGSDKEFRWILTEEHTAESSNFPMDHTSETKKVGRYAYLNTIGQKIKQSASLVSPKHPSTKDACVKFWFYMSSQASKLWVNLTNDKAKNLNEYFEGNLTNGWNSALIPFSSDDDWKVTFEGVVGDSSQVSVALDDIEINFNDSCASAEFCDFERDDCMWHNEASSNLVNDEVDWIRKVGYEAVYQENGPTIDHTTYLPTGYYLLAESAYTNAGGDEVVLVSNVLVDDYKCFSFWYYTNENSGSLEARYYTLNGPQEGRLLRSISLHVINSWQSAIIALPPNNNGPKTNFLIKIVAKLGPGKTEIAIDDIMIEKNSCKDTLAGKFQCKSGSETVFQYQVCDYTKDCLDGSDEINCGNCDFERGTCDYKDASVQPPAEWSVTLAADAEKMSTNAPLDHTLAKNSGHYAWSELRRDAKGILTATMNSPMIQRASSTCHLTFWLYKGVLSGTANPDLLLYILTSHGHLRYQIFDAIDMSKSKWTKALIYVGHISQPFMVEFYSITYSQNTFIAIDDIKFIQCDTQMSLCSDDLFKCASGKGCVPLNRVCDFTADCDDGSDELNCQMNSMGCDFELDTCFWDDLDKNAKWQRAPGDVSILGRDHTLGTPEGYFMAGGYSWSPTEGQKLGGLVFLPSKNCTMRFYYYLSFYKSSWESDLKISTRQYVNGEEKVYLVLDRSSDYFFREEVTFNESKSFEVLFDATIGYYSDSVGLDDISFDSNCHVDRNPLPAGSTRYPDFCPSNKFECKSDDGPMCLDLHKVCNFMYDCEDMTDELDCGTCSFDNGRCGWKDSSSGLYRWERRQAKDFTPDKHKPSITDHTTNSANGWILLLTKNSAGDSFAASSVLESPSFLSSGPTCTLSFWYILSSSAGSLKLSLQSRAKNAQRNIATLLYTQDLVWNYFTVILGELSDDYQVVFDATVSEENGAANILPIAIDDVTFANCTLKDSLADGTFHNLSCDFEKGLCDWHQEIVEDIADWSRINNTNHPFGAGPTLDHTKGDGYYLFLGNNEDRPVNAAKLKSAVLPPTKGLCLQFWYHVFGQYTNTLRVQIISVKDQKPRNILQQMISQGNMWHKAMVNVVSTTPFQVVFSGFVGLWEKSDISLDDILLTKGQCHQPPSLDCSFEQGNCGWKNKHSASPTWLLKQGDQLPINQESDHTTRSPEGQVMLANLLKPSKSANSELQSGTYNSGSNGCCFHYWFSIKPSRQNDSSLRVLVMLLNRHADIVDEAKQGEEPDWQYRQIDIPPNERFQISIIASYYQGAVPVILVDDFRLATSRCLEYGSCDFEYDWCGWSQHADANDIVWLRNSDTTVSDDSNLKKDQDEGSRAGQYASVDASVGNSPNEIVLRSPPLPSGQVACFSLYYHMLGKDIGNLSIYLIQPKTNQGTHDIKERREILFSSEGDNGNSWHQAFIEIYNLTENAKLEIGASLGSGTAGDISVDDLLFEYDVCNNVAITTPSPRSKGNDWVPLIAIPIVLLMAVIAFLAYSRCFGKCPKRNTEDELPIVMESTDGDNPTNEYVQFKEIVADPDEHLAMQQRSSQPDYQVELGKTVAELHEQSPVQQGPSQPEDQHDEVIIHPDPSTTDA